MRSVELKEIAKLVNMRPSSLHKEMHKYNIPKGKWLLGTVVVKILRAKFQAVELLCEEESEDDYE